MKWLVASLFLMFAAVGAQAQVALSTAQNGASDSGVALPEDLTPETVRDLVSTLSDTEVRSLLLERLDAVAAENATDEAAAGGLSELFSNATTNVASSVSIAIQRVPLIPQALSDGFSVFAERLGSDGMSFMALVMTVAIVSALILELGFRRLIRNWVEHVDNATGERSLRQTLSFLFKRLSADIFAVLLFFFAANMIGIRFGFWLAPTWLDGNAAKFQMVGLYIGSIWGSLIVIPRLAAAVGRFMMAPHRPEYRIIFTDDETARQLYRHQIGLAILLGLTFWLPTFLVMSGQQFGDSRIGFWLNLSLHLYLIWLAYRHREGLSLMMRGPDANVSPGEAWAARAYPWFIIISTILIWWVVEILAGYGMFELLRNLPHIYMLILISFAPAMDTIVRGLVRQFMPPMQGEGPVAERAYESARRSYIRIGRVITFTFVIAAIAQIWRLDFSNLASAGVGAQLAGRLIEVLMILAIGYLVYELVSLWINRRLAAEQTVGDHDPHQESGGEGGGAGGSRLSTVLPLILAVARGAILVIFALLALGTLGVDTTPLLAGAGIVGLAIGFGAQKLVTDVVSGIFFLIDDAFRAGEYVEVDGTMGTVEKISIRSMQLRHHRGPVHTIPYGEIPKLTNYSRDWVIMKLRFTVPFDTDPNKVKKIFKKIGVEMMEEDLYKDDFLEPFKSQGVFEFDDVGIVIRGKFMAKPGTQFTIRKEVYNRVKRELNAAGIDFARREVRVAIPGLENANDIDDATKSAVGAAASQAAQDLPPEQK